MEDRKNPISSPGRDGPIDANLAPVAMEARRRTFPDDGIAARDQIESRMIVFCGDQQQVNEGFAMALRVIDFVLAGNELNRVIPAQDREHPELGEVDHVSQPGE